MIPIENPYDLKFPSSLYGGGLVMPYLEYEPHFGEDVFLAPGSVVIGRVMLGDNVSIWPGAALRGDIAEIRVGRGSNIQDNSVLHVGSEVPCLIGENVTVGHRAMLHACVIENGCLIGMGAIVLDGAMIGEASVVGAGALVTKNTIVAPRSLVLGAPAKVKRTLTADELEEYSKFGPKYVGVARNYRQEAKE